MTQPISMAQQIAQTAITFEEQRLGRKPSSVTVVLGGDTLVITMHGVLSPAEKAVGTGLEAMDEAGADAERQIALPADPMNEPHAPKTSLTAPSRTFGANGLCSAAAAPYFIAK